MRLEEATAGLLAILRAGKKEVIPKGEIIRSSEDSQKFYLVSKGYVKRYFIRNSGQLDVQSIYGPNYFLPLITVFTKIFEMEIYEGPEMYYYQAMTPAVVYSVDGAELANMAQKNPTLYKELLAIAGRRLHANIHQIENRGLRDSYKRVAHQVLFLVREFGEQKPSGIKVMIPVTHQDIADMLSLSRETVTLAMGRLENKKIIKAGRAIIVPDLERLSREAYK